MHFGPACRRLFRKAPAKPSPLERRVDQAYNIGDQIGEGQFAQVFRAKLHGMDMDMGASGGNDSFHARPMRSQRTCQSPTGTLMHVPSDVAIKTIDKGRVGEMGDLDREVEIMRSVAGHPNILQLYETFDEPRKLHLVLELLNGGNLFDLIVDKGYFSEAEAAALLVPLCSALDHMHGMMIVHRDIKPEK